MRTIQSIVEEFGRKFNIAYVKDKGFAFLGAEIQDFLRKELEARDGEVVGEHNARILNEYQLQGLGDERALFPVIEKATKETLHPHEEKECEKCAYSHRANEGHRGFICECSCHKEKGCCEKCAIGETDYSDGIERPIEGCLNKSCHCHEERGCCTKCKNRGEGHYYNPTRILPCPCHTKDLIE